MLSWQVVVCIVTMQATFCITMYINHLRSTEEGRRDHARRLIESQDRATHNMLTAAAQSTPRASWAPHDQRMKKVYPPRGPFLSKPGEVIPMRRKTSEEIGEEASRVMELLELAVKMPEDEQKKFLEAHGIHPQALDADDHDNA